MTGQQLRPLLDELAAEVRTPDLARRAWEAGRRRRRRVRTAASTGSALAVALAVGGTALVATPDRDRDAVTAPTGPAAVSTSSAAGASAPAPERVDGTISIAPSRAEETRLPWTTSTALPRRISLAGTHPVLTADPPERVLAIFQQWGDQPGQLLALGSDGRLRAVEVELVQPRDAQGNVALPLDETSLRPDGLAAAFAEPDRVTLVDLRTGDVRRLPLPGFNEDVRWHPDGRRLLVGRETGSVLLDTGTGRAQPIGGARAFGDSTFTEDGSELLTLSSPEAAADGSPKGPPLLFRNAVAGGYSGSVVELASGDIGSWHGATHVKAGVVVRGGWLRDGLHEAVTVVDTSGTVRRQLRFSHEERWKGCCGVVGWLDDRRVVLTSRGDGPGRLLVWDIESDALSRLVEFDAATVSLARL